MFKLQTLDDVKEMSAHEVKLSSKEKFVHDYKFLCAELSEGLNYGISDELLEEHYSIAKEAFGEDVKIPSERPKDIYEHAAWMWLCIEPYIGGEL